METLTEILSSYSTISHYEIHNGKGKVLAKSDRWQLHNKNTLSFDSLVEAKEYLSGTRKRGKIMEYNYINKAFRVEGTSRIVYEIELTKREVYEKK